MLRNSNGRGEGLGRRFVALALAEILCFQSLMGTGVAQAIAPSAADVAPVTQVADGAGPESGKDAAKPTDWTRRADAVTVTAPGLELDVEKLQALVGESGELPQRLPATLSLEVTVAGQVGEGDTLDLALPENFLLDVEALAADGDAAAEAPAEDSQPAVAVSAVEGAEAALRLTYALSAEEGASVTVDVPVLVDASAFGEEAAEVAWTPVEGVDEATVGLPALADVRELAGIAEDGQEPADDGPASNNDVPAAPQAGADPAPALTTPAIKVELVTSRDVDAKASFTTIWADSNSDLRPSAETLEKSHEYRAYFQVEGDDAYYPLTEKDGVTVSDDAVRLLGYSQEILNSVRGDEELVGVDRTAVNTYTASTVELPSTYVTSTQAKDDDGALLWQTDNDGEYVLDANGNKQPVWNSESHKVTYAVRHEVTDNQYLYEDSSGQPRYQVASGQTYGEAYVKPYERECIQLIEDVTFNFKFKEDPNLKNPDALEWAKQWARLQTLIVTKKGSAQKEFKISGDQWVNLMGGTDSNHFVSSWTSADTSKISALVPVWHPDGSQLEYSLTQDPAVMDSSGEYEDFYQVRYDNSTAPDHGGDTSALFNGGTLIVTHVGTTHFSASKRWLDDDAGSRPATHYSLWRFSAGTGSYATATQVRVGDGNVPVEFDVSAEENAAAGNGTIDLGLKVMDLVRAQDGSLAKYDPDGVPYVYELREDAPHNDYERLNGTKVNQETGNPEGDVSPNYYKPDGMETTTVSDDFARSDVDKGVYNGGTLINRRSAKQQVSVTKTWNAGAFQDQLRDVKVTFKLQRILKRHAKQDGGLWVSRHDPIDPDDPSMGTYEWNDDIDGEVVVDEVSDWYAEKLTQSLSGTYNRYDHNGEEWVYRWVEAKVEDPVLGSHDISDKDTANSSFPLWLTDAEGNEETVMFQGSYDPETGTIVNSYVNKTDQHVDKLWAVTDASGNAALDKDGNPAYTQDAKPNGHDAPAVTMRIFRDGSLYGKAVLDGVVDDVPNNLVGDGADGGTAQETSPWHLDLNNLPKYDDEGREYTYLVLEEEVPGYSSRREYDPQTRTTTIRNTPVGSGDVSIARVTKTWADDGNSTSRTPVLVGVYADRQIAGANGVSYAKDQLIGTVELNASHGWYGEFSIPVGGLSYGNGFYVREISRNPADGTDYKYDVLTRSEAKQSDDADIKNGLLNWPENNPDNPWNEVLFSKSEPSEGNAGKFAYLVSYGYNDEVGAACVTNLRVGQVWISLQKNWEDLGADPAKRPSASYVISCDEISDVFHADENDYVYATLGQNAPAQYVRNGKPGADGVEGIMRIGEDGVCLESGNLIIPVSRDGSCQAHVDALPKYDEAGAIVHYRVTERWDGERGDYQSSQTGYSEDYSSRWHGRDRLSYSFTNRRSNTKDVTFHMKWYDAYVKEELNQRPDIYLTVYRTVYLYDEDGNPVYNSDGSPAFTTEVVTGYENYKWRPNAEEGKDARYNEYAVIGDLPKYDEHGREIVYYASASMSVSTGTLADLDYQSSWFTYSANDPDPGNRGWDEADSEVSAADKRILVGTATGKGDDGYAVREDGTFNFRIESNLIVRGSKHWVNLPGNFDDSADLPALSVYLQRRLAGGSYDASGAWKAGDPVDWSDLSVSGSDTSYKVKDYLTEGEGVADGQTAVAWAHGLTRANANLYEFLFTHFGLNTIGETGDSSQTALPKYDSNGRRYEYRVQEIADGLLPNDGSLVPGGTTPGSDRPGGGVFTPFYGTNSYSISNVYNSQKGRLTVKKLYDGRQQGDKFPSVTFRLYRYYVKSDGTKSGAEQVGTKVLRSSDVTEVDGGSRGTGAVTFDGLDIYAPSGQYWVYYVTESEIDGYSELASKDLKRGDLDFDSSADSWSSDWTLNECASADLVEGMELQPDNRSFSQPTSSAVADDDKVDVTFKNTYDDQYTTVLTGTKRWYDQGNAFGTRPDGVTLRLVRTYQDGTLDAGTGNADGTVTLQVTDPESPNYLSWKKPEGSDTWSYTIQKVERFAPDGKPWRYTVSETSTGSDQYSVSGSSKGGTVSAGPGSALPLIANYLKTKVDVTKAWVDSNDPWLQRPDVYVGLQLRYSADGGASWSDWTGAENALASLGVKAADGSRLTSLSGRAFEQKLDASNNWSFEWNDVPTEAKVNGTAYSLEWRAVETCLVYDPGAGEVATKWPIGSPDESGAYGEYHPYQPSQSTDKTTNGQGDTVFRTAVTNTLSETSVSATKSWQDESNKWGSRPGTTGAADAWSVTYVLQRTTGDPADEGAAWSWVSKYGAPVADGAALDVSGNLNELLLTATIGGSGDSGAATFDHLPASDPAGEPYAYRLVELVRGSYNVIGTTVASTADGRVRLVAVRTAVGGQQFSNVLLSVSVSGHKLWNDFGAGLVPPFSKASEVRLELQSSLDGKDWTAVKRADGRVVEPVWTQIDAFDWTFSYSGLPKTDQEGRAYQYRVREVGNASNGFVDSYGSDASVDGATGNVTSATITNTATRFSLEKLGDGTTGSGGERLAGVTLKVRGASDGKTYAVWTRDLDASGNLVTRSYVCPAGVAEAADARTDLTPGNGFIEMTGENAGLVIGLHAGTYKVHESRVPDGHLRAADATFVLDRDGSIAGLVGATKTRSNNVDYVTMVDPVLRGNVELYKYYTHDGAKVALPGMTFDLYKGDASQPESAALLVAEGITTGKAKTDGAGRTYLWTSGPLGAGNDKIAIKHDTNGNSVLGKLGKYFQTLSDGLPEGSYFLKETGESHLVESSQMTIPFTVSANSDTTRQPLYEYLKAENAEFNAAVTLAKTDSETGAAVSGATFELLYQAPGAPSYVTVASGLQTGSAYAGNASGTSFSHTGDADAGRLNVSGLKKGSYQLVETSNLGYSIDDESRPTASWTITNDDQGQTIDLAADGQPKVSWTGANPTGGSLANQPLHADVLLTKTDSEAYRPLDRVGFTLQRKVGEDFKDVSSVGVLYTGRAYALAVDSGGSITGAAEVADQAVSGQLKVSNLPWGTYRLVETGALPGYASAEVGGAPVAREFKVDRQSFAESASGPTIDLEGVFNRQTDLVIRKANADGTASLSGAKFTLSGMFADGSTMKTLVTGDDGLAVPETEADAVRGQLLVGNSYKLTETVPPDGYGLPSPASVTLTVAADGSLTSDDAEGTAFALASAGGLTTVTVEDAPTRVMLRKVDQNGKPLLGATFTVKGNFSDGSVEKVVSPAGTNATFVSEGHLVAGETYEISETVIPAGYAKVTDAKFCLAEDGKSVKLTGSYAGWSVADDGLTITAQDQPVRLTLAKSSTDGAPLSGATFKVKGPFVTAGAVKQGERTLVVGADGTVELMGAVANADYVISEVAAPSGFRLSSGSATVHVDAYGNASLGEGSAGFSLDGSRLTLSDEPIRLSFAKADGDGNALDGALFSVSGVFADGQGHLLNEGQATTLEGLDVSALSDLNFVQGQTYTLKETRAPAGYELISGKLTFSVGTDGKATLDASEVSNGSYAVSAEGASITAFDEPIEVSLAKAGEKGEPLAGATFAIRPHDGGTFADGSSELTLTTGSDGRAGLSGLLVAGRTYELEETEAPEGHKRLSGTILVNVNADGTLATSGSQAGVSNGVVKVEGDAIAVTDEAVPFSITKYGTDDNGRIDTGLPLSGAHFTVTGTFAGDDGERTVEVVSGQDGKAGSELAGRLVVGRTYVIRETKAPDGYVQVQGSLTVLVNDDGTLSAVGSAPAEFQLTRDGSLLVFGGGVSNSRSRLEVIKASANNPLVRLSGASFEVTPADGSSFAYAVEGGRLEATTYGGADASGSPYAGWAEFDRGALRADGTSVYVLRETRAPEGYELNDGEVFFKLMTDGTVVLLASNDPDDLLTAEGAAAMGYGVDAEGGITVTAADEPVEVSVVKRGEGGRALPGATFTLSCADGTNSGGRPNHFSNGSASDVYELVTSADGTVQVAPALLVAGNSYVLEETTAPAGHALDSRPLTFKVASDGTVTATDGPDSYQVSNEGQVTISMTDAPTRLGLSKRASDGADAAAMAGAVFEVAPDEGYAFSDGTTEARRVTIGEDGSDAQLVGILNTDAIYEVREVEPPAGYALLPDVVRLAVRQDGSVALAEGQAPEGWTLSDEGGLAVLAATDAPVSLSLAKSSTDGAPLSGATFKVKGPFVTAGAVKQGERTLVVGADGTVELMGAVANADYVISEVAAPSGFRLSSGSATVHVDAYGNASLGEGSAGFSLDGSRLTLSDEPIRLSFAKADGDGNALDGALFSVSGVFADGQGHLLNEGQATTLEGLDVSALSDLNFVQGQTYTLKETRAPAGYELISGKLTFSVGTDGKATLDASEVSNGSYAVSADGASITAVDEPIEAQVTKVSSADGTALAGATFTLSPADGKNADGQPNCFADASAAGALDLVTGEDGVAHIPAATLAAGNAYVLVETAAPAGYVLAEGSFTFVVAPDGTLVAGEGSKAYELLSDGQVGVRVSDDPAPGVVPGGSGVAPFTGDATSSAMACLLLAGGLALVASGLRRRRRRG